MKAYARLFGLTDDAFSVVFNAAPVMMWLTGPDGLRTFCNKQWLDFTGRTLDQELGLGWTDNIHPDDLSSCLAAMDDAVHQRRPFEMELRMRRADGAYRWVLDTGVPRLDGDGKFAGYVGSCVDISRRRHVETALHAVEDRDITQRVQGEDSFRRLAGALQRAREQERTAVARELHDELGQTLTSLKMDLVRATTDLTATGTVSVDRLQSMIGSVELATNTVRRVATSLRPPALDHFGLVAAIELEAAGVSRYRRVRCRVIAKKPVASLTPDQSTALFRIVQESLTNVLRHAEASAVTITISQRSKQLSIAIRDNGRGIMADQIDNPSSMGLLGMRERAALAGGTVDISATPGRGTTVVVTLPTP